MEKIIKHLQSVGYMRPADVANILCINERIDLINAVSFLYAITTINSSIPIIAPPANGEKEKNYGKQRMG